MITNPILPGFNPDPCICRVGPDYFLAVSSFEWWPGVPIYHSTNLVHWEITGYAVTDRIHANLYGVPDSAGIWAPCLSFHDGQFFLIFSVVKNFADNRKDLTNFVMTARSVSGPWSEPEELNRSGFDPSLYHDDDGNAWLLNQLWDHRASGKDRFAGIVIQKYDYMTRRLTGPVKTIFAGSERGITEGPHVYKRGEWYYLITAEGGTGWDHAVTVARARTIEGPFQLSPYNPLLSSQDAPSHPLQKAGHASLVENEKGDWYLAHLCSRPIGPRRRCILGRETALQEVKWTATGWPVLAHGSQIPAINCVLTESFQCSTDSAWRDDFDDDCLDLRWRTLREPPTESWLSRSERKGCLRLRGRHSLDSLLDVSLVATPVKHHYCSFETSLEFEPNGFQDAAGIALYYNTSCYHALYLTYDDTAGRCLELGTRDAGQWVQALPSPVPVGSGVLGLRARLSAESLCFEWRVKGGDWCRIGPVLDATILSDDYFQERNLEFAFTGTFAALFSWSASGLVPPADFMHAAYSTMHH